MKTMNKLVVVLAMGLPAFGQATKPKVPTVPVEVRERYFKAQYENLLASNEVKDAVQKAQSKQVVLQQKVKDIESACGTGYHPVLDGDGDIACAENPKTPDPVKK